MIDSLLTQPVMVINPGSVDDNGDRYDSWSVDDATYNPEVGWVGGDTSTGTDTSEHASTSTSTSVWLFPDTEARAGSRIIDHLGRRWKVAGDLEECPGEYGIDHVEGQLQRVGPT